MAKKGLLVLALAVFAAGGVFAQADFKLSAGGGVILVPGFQEMKPKGGGDAQKTSGFGGGLNLFFDATYAEVNLGLIFANQKGEGADKGIDSTNLTIGLVGKYPISLNDKLVLFPFAGIDYLINLGASNEGTKMEDVGDLKVADRFNALSVLFGLGADFNITEALYIRGEAGFGITFNTKIEDDMKDFYDSNFKGKIPVKIAVGYRF